METRSLGDGIEIHQWYPIIIWYPRIHQTIPYKTWDSSPVFCLSHHPDLDQNHEEKTPSAEVQKRNDQNKVLKQLVAINSNLTSKDFI